LPLIQSQEEFAGCGRKENERGRTTPGQWVGCSRIKRKLLPMSR
jgi:hypothetical protein